MPFVLFIIYFLFYTIKPKGSRYKKRELQVCERDEKMNMKDLVKKMVLIVQVIAEI